MEGMLHHVSIIVPDDERVAELAELFGLQLGRRQYVAQYEADCIFTTGDHGIIEFIIAKSGKLSRFNKGMGGLHHIAIAVADLEVAKKELAAKGIPFLENRPVDAGPISINFVEPAYTRGVIVEYVQRTEADAAPAAGGGGDRARPDEQQIFKQVRAKRAAGQVTEAAEQLRDVLRRGWLSPEGVDKAGKQIARYVDESGTKPLDVLLLGQCTTHWVGSSLTASAWAGATSLRVTEGQYDNVIQELMAAANGERRYDAVVLLPWHQRLFAAGRGEAQARIDDELAFWQQAWQIVSTQMSARLIQIGYDWTSSGPSGHHLAAQPGGAVALVRQLNERLRASMPASGFFVDLEQASGQMGRDHFYDARRYFWTKQPFSEAGAASLAEHVWSGLRAVVNGPKKVLVLDLDNTLWGGVVGETGPLGVEVGDGPVGEAFKAFQEHVKALSTRGCLLAVSSKNNLEDAREPFEKNPALPLRLSDFAAFEASWEPKSVAIQRMAKTLQLGLDSFVFFDDNPAEREHVRQMLPEVAVVDVPEDPALYVRALEAGQWFEALSVTAEDRERTEQYRAEAQRREVQKSFATMDEYLTSLEMTGDVRDIDEADLPRVVQLLGKTNQFNLTTRRHPVDAVSEMLGRPRSVGLTVRIADRFADYGLVAVLLGVDDPSATVPTLRVDTWLMSCRVIARTVEEFCLGCLVEAASAKGYARIVGDYLPTKKNALVADLYDRLGFARTGEGANGAVSYEMQLAGAKPGKSFVARRA